MKILVNRETFLSKFVLFSLILIIGIYTIIYIDKIGNWSEYPIRKLIVYLIITLGSIQSFWALIRVIKMLNKEYIINFEEKNVLINVPTGSYSLKYSEIEKVEIKKEEDQKSNLVIYPKTIEKQNQIFINEGFHKSSTISLFKEFKRKIKAKQ